MRPREWTASRALSARDREVTRSAGTRRGSAPPGLRYRTRENAAFGGEGGNRATARRGDRERGVYGARLSSSTGAITGAIPMDAEGESGKGETEADTAPENGFGHSRNRHLECRCPRTTLFLPYPIVSLVYRIPPPLPWPSFPVCLSSFLDTRGRCVRLVNGQTRHGQDLDKRYRARSR